MDENVNELKDIVLDAYKDVEDLRKELHFLKHDKPYKPKYNIKKIYSDFKNRTDDNVLLEMVREFDIEYVDEKWQKADWILVFIAGTVGIICDILITQSSILRPIDKNISKFMGESKTISNFQNNLDRLSHSFRDGQSAPIDFQDFSMYGPKSMHEQYSFGHDPLRFIEGIIQIMTGNYRGIDTLGKIVNVPFGQGTGVSFPGMIQAIISYVAHMVSDLCNKNSLPYPGSTLLMQFGGEGVRKEIEVAYRAQLYNSRTFIYQNIPSFLMSIIIHCWAIYDNYTRTRKIKILIGNSLKYQPMLLVSNAMVATSNLTINSVRAIIGDPHVLFRVNWPVITNTVRHAIKYFILENKRIIENGKRIEAMYMESERNKLEKKTEEEYLASMDDEYEEFEKSMGEV